MTQENKLPSNEAAYDVYIHYNEKDSYWVENELLPTLESWGLKAGVDFLSFRVGAPRIKELVRLIEISKKILLILTENFLQDSWSESGLLMIQTLDPSNRELKLIPLIKEKCKLPLEIRYLTYLDFADPWDWNVAWAQLKKALGLYLPLDATEDELADPNAYYHREDWGEAIELQVFFGRDEELSALENWIINEKIRLIGVLGSGGIGKSTFTLKVAKDLGKHFNCVFWRDLRNAPPFDKVIGECIKFLSNQQRIDLPQNGSDKITLLIKLLKEHRSLLVLDNFETVLEPATNVGKYLVDYQMYGELINRIGASSHGSCLILASREEPNELKLLDDGNLPVRVLHISGLNLIQGKLLLKSYELIGSDEAWQKLIDLYSGNPLALKQVASTIRDLFNSNISYFLDENMAIFGEINQLLKQQFSRLSDLEKDIMFWLTIEREAISISSVRADILQKISTAHIFDAFESLQRRSLIEKSSGLFTLQPVIMEFITNKLVEEVDNELSFEEPNLLNKYALIKSQAKDYLKEAQARIIVDPIIDRVTSKYSKQEVQNKLLNMIANQQTANPRVPAYLAGNILNILILMESNITNLDFSNLAIWQASLQGVFAKNVNFSQANLLGCSFTEIFGNIPSVDFSPDGNYIATGTTTGEIRVWSVSDGTQVLKLEGHHDWVMAVKFSPDGRRLISGSSDKDIRVWDIEKVKCIAILRNHDAHVTSIAYSLDGDKFATASTDRTIILWDAITLGPIKTFVGHQDWIRSISFSSDALFLVSGSEDRTVRLWDTLTGNLIKVLDDHQGKVRTVAFSPDGELIASGGDDHTVKLWSSKTGECLKTFTGHSSRVWTVAFSPDNLFLASGGDDQIIRILNLETGQYTKTLQGHTGWVNELVFSPSSDLLVSGGEDQSARIWDTKSGLCVRTFKGYTNPIWNIAVSPNGQLLATAEEPEISLWNIEEGKVHKKLIGHTNWVEILAFSPNGRRLASGSGDSTIKIWDLETGRLMQTLKGHSGTVRGLTFVPNGDTLISSAGDGTIRIWEIMTGKCVNILRGHQGRIDSIACNSAGSLLASGSNDAMLRIWNIPDGNCIKILRGHTSRIWSVAFSPDDKWIISGGDDQTVRIWDTFTWQISKVLQGHSHRIRTVAIDSEGKLIASGSEDQTIRLWEFSTGKCTKILEGHKGRITSVAFGPGNQILFSGCTDETIKFWNLENGQNVSTFYSNRPYEGMNITGATGLTEAQKNNLLVLGAIDNG